MNNLAKLIAAIAALASLALAWISKEGVTVHHEWRNDNGAFRMTDAGLAPARL